MRLYIWWTNRTKYDSGIMCMEVVREVAAEAEKAV